jgi:type II secretion system protein H
MRLYSFIVPSPRGFTLVESLLVLALLVLGAMVLLPAAGAVFRRARLANPEEEIAVVLQQVRREAVLRGHEVLVRFDARTQRFVWDGSAGADLAGKAPRLEIGILRQAAGSAVMIGGRQVETSLQPAMKFYPDGTCDPVRLQLRVAQGEPRLMAIDPWTCAPGLEAGP